MGLDQQPVSSGELIGDADIHNLAIQGSRQGSACHIRMVVLPAQVGCNHMPESRVVEIRCDLRGLGIGQVTMLATDPRFQKWGVPTGLQGRQIMIAFQQQGVAVGQALQDMRRRMAQISQHAKVAVSVRATQLQRFAGIVRNREWCQHQIADGNRHMILCDVQVAV